MKLYWDTTIASSGSLYMRATPRDRRVAWVALTFKLGDGAYSPKSRWRARIVATGEEQVFESSEQAKDWAQTVVLLNQ